MIRSDALKNRLFTGTFIRFHLVLLVAAVAFVPLRASKGNEGERSTNRPFLRGDANQDGKVALSDVISILGCVYLGGSCSECLDALDGNDDGKVDISDPVSLLQWLFLGGSAPPAPGARMCGVDPTPDDLAGCAYSSRACGDALPPADPAPFTVTGVEPREVDDTGAAVTLTISGEGFEDDVFVRLYYPDEGTLSLDVKPATVRADRVVAEIEPGWFKELAAASVPSPAGVAVAGNGPDHFFLKVIRSGGASSQPCVVLIQRFALRLTLATPRGPMTHGGDENVMDVDLEWRTWKDAVQLVLAAFEAPPSLEGVKEPQALLLKRIPGIQGSVMVRPGTRQTSIPVSLASDVLPGRYLVQVLVKSLPSIQASTPARELSVTSTEVIVTKEAERRSVILKSKNPPPPGPDENPPQVDPPLPPEIFWIDLHVQSESPDAITVRWKYPPASTGHALERMVSIPQPDKWPWEEVEWKEIAAFDQSDATDGWIEFTDEDGFYDDCSVCYRVRAWNKYGESTSREACTAEGDSWIHGDDPPTLLSAEEFDWGFLLDWTAHVRASGTPWFRFYADVPGFSDGWKLFDSGTGFVHYVWGIYWSDLDALEPHVGSSRKIEVFLQLRNACNATAFSNKIGVTMPQRDPPNNPPNNPPDNPPDPPSSPTPDLGFWQGIYLSDASFNGVSFVAPGQSVGVCWGAANYGNAGTGSFTDTLFLDGGNAWPHRLVSVGWPGWSDLEYRWYPQGFSAGDHSLEVHLDALNEVSPEVTENNNSHYIGILVGL